MSEKTAEGHRCMHCFLSLEPAPAGSPSPYRAIGSLRTFCFDRVPHKLLPDVELSASD